MFTLKASFTVDNDTKTKDLMAFLSDLPTGVDLRVRYFSNAGSYELYADIPVDAKAMTEVAKVVTRGRASEARP